MSSSVQPIKDDVSLVEAALKKTRATFQSGKTRPIEFRIQQLNNLKRGLQTMQKELQDAVKADIGRDNFITWFMETSLIEKEIDHAVANIYKWAKPINVDTPVYLGPAKSRIEYEPLGVVCVMGSWNFPIYTVLAPFIDVIAAGNCAVLKPSEIAPNTLRKLKSLFARNMDSSSYVCLEGQVEVAKALSSSKFDCICFTGSSEKGKLVAAAAG